MPNEEIPKKELLRLRAIHVQDFVNSNARRGVPVKRSVRLLSGKILFLTQRTIYNDLAKKV